jgi:hypothetical protein
VAAAHTRAIGGRPATFNSSSGISLSHGALSLELGTPSATNALCSDTKLQPVSTETSVRKDAIRDIELLLLLRGPGLEYTTKAPKSTTTKLVPASLTDRPHVVAQEVRARVDQIGKPFRRPAPCSDVQEVALRLPLRLPGDARRLAKREWTCNENRDRRQQHEEPTELHTPGSSSWRART